MIFARRIRISGQIELKSDLHVGGSDVQFDIDKDGEERRFSAIIRQQDGKPIIPASSLKGVLRSTLGKGAHRTELFGEEHKDGSGRVARLWLDHAVMSEAAADLEDLSDHPAEGGVFRSKHVAIEPATGAAAPNKLYDREMVAAGATFAFEAVWFEEKLDRLAPVFALLRDGCQVGGGVAKGRGRITLAPETLEFFFVTPGKDGQLVESALDRGRVDNFLELLAKTACPRPTLRRVTLTLKGEGPYLSVRTSNTDESGNEMQPLRRAGKPVLWSTSVAGALRARARWLAACKATERVSVDEPDRKRGMQELRTQLTDTERLFGVTGCRGALRVAAIRCVDPGTEIRLSNNGIDRFTGATRNTVLFGKRSYWKPDFEVDLEVEGEHALFDSLLADFGKDDILELGHGSSTGYGWFKVEVSDDGA